MQLRRAKERQMKTAKEMKERAEEMLAIVWPDSLLRFPVTITGSAESLCDPSIDILGVSIFAVNVEIGVETIQAFQVATVEYIHSDPPDENIIYHEEPECFDDAMVEACKLLVEDTLVIFLADKRTPEQRKKDRQDRMRRVLGLKKE